MNFPTQKPEDFGLKPADIYGFLKALSDFRIPMHSVSILVDNNILFETYYYPFKKEKLHRMFSIAKSYTAVAIGLLIDENKLTLSDHICDFFTDKLPKEVHSHIAEMTIENLLSMRTCYSYTTYKQKEWIEGDWVKSFFNSAPDHKPGTIFHYDTAAAHVLCALVERVSGMDIMDYLRSRLSILNLSKESYFIKDPCGVSQGGSGLMATPGDILKMGLLLANEGSFEGTRLLSEEFCIKATSFITPTAFTNPQPFESNGYGYYIWRNEKDGFMLYGMGGQFVSYYPKKKLMLVTTADTQGIAGGNQIIFDCFYKYIYERIQEDPVEVTDKEVKELNDFSKSAHVLLLKESIEGCKNSGNNPSKKEHNCSLNKFGNGFFKKSYKLFENKNGIDSVTIDTDDFDLCKLNLCFKDGRIHSLPFMFSDNTLGTLPESKVDYLANAAWIDECTLYIKYSLMGEYMGPMHVEIHFSDNNISMYIRKNEESILSEYLGHFDGTVYCS